MAPRGRASPWKVTVKGPFSVPILTYHHVCPDGHPALVQGAKTGARGLVAAGVFRRHLQLLEEGGWQIRSTSEVMDWLIAGSELPEKTVAIQFDNGWLDTWEVAKPILDEFGARALVYVIAGLTEGSSAAGGSSFPQGWTLRTRTEGRVSSVDHAVITWRQVEALLQSGWEVGAHTLTHPRLTQLLAQEGAEAVRGEIEKSNQMLRDRLGLEPIHFAYPSGDWNEEVEKIVAPYYRSLRLWRLGPPWLFTHRNTLPSRIECQNIDAAVSPGEIGSFLGAAARGAIQA